MSVDSVLETLVEIKLKNPNDFLIVKETLSRIGVTGSNLPGEPKKLYQTMHILHKRDKYYLPHFKEMFLLDGKNSSFNQDDLARRNTIANLLQDWGLVELVEPEKTKSPTVALSKIVILSHKDKHDYQLIQKYTIGSKGKMSS